jgi:hypothetical protein
MTKPIKVAILALLLVGTGGALALPSSPVERDLPKTRPTEINVKQLLPPTEKPDYDREVLVPLREAQAEAAEKARVAAAKAAREAAERQAAEAAVYAKRTAQAAPSAVPAHTDGSHTDWMAAAGIQPSDFQYVEYIISRESGWRYWVSNNEGSGATGLGQALPASKMAPFGADYLTNPVTQLKWANAYAVGRYGSWAGAYRFWLTNRVW